MGITQKKGMKIKLRHTMQQHPKCHDLEQIRLGMSYLLDLQTTAVGPRRRGSGKWPQPKTLRTWTISGRLPGFFEN